MVIFGILVTIRRIVMAASQARKDIDKIRDRQDYDSSSIRDILRGVENSLQLSNKALLGLLKHVFPEEFEVKKIRKVKKKFKAPKRRMIIRHKGKLYSVEHS